MLSKRTILLALAILVLVVPFGTGIAAADSYNSPQPPQGLQPLSLSLTGGVLNAGTQHYVLAGGHLIASMIDGVPLMPGATVKYHMYAQVSGISTNGFFEMSIRGTDMNGQIVKVVARGHIISTPNAIPVGCSGNVCTSEIPTFFLSESQVHTWIAGQESTAKIPITIESAYLNPFGGPIVISSTDGSIFVEASYTRATISWRGVQMGGTISTLGDNTPTGAFTMNVNSYENLLTGTEFDRGAISMILPQGSYSGYFHGKSVVPTRGEFDCTAMTGLPSGTCMMTGLNSTGRMNLYGSGLHITGTYHTVWLIPAVGFTSTVSATATPVQHYSYHQIEQDSDN